MESSSPSDHPRYLLGLDIGVASIGWAIVSSDERREPARLLRLGVHTFDPGVEGDIESGHSNAKAQRAERPFGAIEPGGGS